MPVQCVGELLKIGHNWSQGYTVNGDQGAGTWLERRKRSEAGQYLIPVIKIKIILSEKHIL